MEGFRCALRVLFGAVALAGCASLRPAGPPAADGMVNAPPLPPASPDPAADQAYAEGLRQLYLGRPAAAEAHFLRALGEDPRCGLCWWGAAWAADPPLAGTGRGGEAERDSRLAEAARWAGSSERTQDYVAVLQAHAAAPLDPERGVLAGLRELVRRQPEDPHARLLLVATLLERHGWVLHDNRGEPRPWTAEIEEALEHALVLAPASKEAHRLYAHVVEGSLTPERGLPSTQRLERRHPGDALALHASALVHARTGRYRDALMKEAGAPGSQHGEVCPYAPEIPLSTHAGHSRWWLALMAGRHAAAATLAQGLAQTEARQALSSGLRSLPGLTQWRFGRWSELVSAALPLEPTVYERMLWHVTTGTAQLRLGNDAEAVAQLEALRELRGAAAQDPRTAAVYPIAAALLDAELAMASGDPVMAVTLLQEAVAHEDRLPYAHPPAWPVPTRHVLGAMLLQAERAADAERVYRDDLVRNRDNGWALFGLAQALRQQHRAVEALAIEERLRRAWKGADVTLIASYY